MNTQKPPPDKSKEALRPNQPGPAKNVGEDTANPLPDDYSDGDGADGSDPGRD